MKVNLELDFSDAEIEQLLKDKGFKDLAGASDQFHIDFKKNVFAMYINGALSTLLKEALLNPTKYKRDRKIDNLLLEQ